jgi:hypothetical protein
MSKNNMHPEAILTSPSVVQHAVRQGKHNRMEMEATAMAIALTTLPDTKCSQQNALNAARTLKCRSNRVKVDRSIAVIVTVK